MRATRRRMSRAVHATPPGTTPNVTTEKEVYVEVPCECDGIIADLNDEIQDYKKEIKSYKKDVKALEKKITKLEKELED